MRALLFLPPLIFAALAALFIWGMGRGDPRALPSTLIGQKAPALALAPLPPHPALTDAALTAPGVKIVNFWASWCAPCRAEHPQLMQLKAEGLPVYGVNYKDQPSQALAFLAELGNPYAALGGEAGPGALNWGVYGVPETFVIDGKGKVVLRFAGPITQSILETTIRPALTAAP